MAIFKITSGAALAPFILPSIDTGGLAFLYDTPAADTLTIELGAFLISTGNGGAYLSNSGNWTVNVAGLLQGQLYGLYVQSPSTTMTVTEDGAIRSVAGVAISHPFADPLNAISSTFSLINKGSVWGLNTAIYTEADTSTITNSGSIIGNIDTNNGLSKITNSGTIDGALLLGTGNDIIKNTGTFTRHILLEGGNNSLTNGATGIISSLDTYYDGANNGISVKGGIANDIIVNDGRIRGYLYLGDGTNSLTNSASGVIGTSLSDPFNPNFQTIQVSYHSLGLGSNTVINKGILEGGIQFGDGKNTVDNSGQLGFAIVPGNSHLSVIGGNGDDTVKNTGFLGGAVQLASGVNTFTNSGIVGVDGASTHSYLGLGGANKITNSITGILQGGIYVDGVAVIQNSLTNAGIIGKDSALQSYAGSFGGADTVINSGTLEGYVSLREGLNKLTNTGFIGKNSVSVSVRGGNDEDIISNSKIFAGSVELFNGKNSFTNSGVVGEVGQAISYVGGNNNDTVTNSGTLFGSIDLGNSVDVSPGVAGLNLVTNSGVIDGRIFGGDGSDKVDNKASGVTGFIYLEDGTNTLLNAGIIRGEVAGGNGIDTFTNSGTIAGTVHLFDGDDVFNNTGKILSAIDLGAGNDKFTGGSFVDIVVDGLGLDTIILGGGVDLFQARYSGNLDNPLDKIDGGLGIDTYDASLLSNLNINLGTIDHVHPFSISIAKNLATGFGETDLVFNFEKVIGTNGSDTIVGSSAANVLQGRAGIDNLFGYAGNDTLDGGAGIDLIVGGVGADILTGGADGDSFWYSNINESGRTALTRDTITDFVVGASGDVINLSAIDANTKTAGTNDAFDFIGTNVVWRGVAGDLRAVWTAAGQVIECDVNGDRISDFSIFIADGGNHVALSGANGVDFIL